MNSQKLLRNVLEFAMSLDLEKNEIRVFMALVNQTIGYGKRSDPLTMGRIAKLTGIRKDRVGKALSGLVGKGVFDRDEHKHFDFTYSIPAKFFDGEIQARFFAPSISTSGTICQPAEAETHSSGTYRDIPLQRLTNTETNMATVAPAPKSPIKAESVCAVNDNSVIEKPEAVEQEAYQALMPALKTLPKPLAVQVLQLVSLAVLDGSIKTTQQRLAGGLIKAARAGTLDTSRLAQIDETAGRKLKYEKLEIERREREKAQERVHLEWLAKAGGVDVRTLRMTP